MTVHRIGNCSDYDNTGRLTRFRVQTQCGRPLRKPLCVTDDSRRVTCGSCRRVNVALEAIGVRWK